MDHRETLNRVLVHLFGDILRIEERALTQTGVRDVSIREIHILEAVSQSGEDNTMSGVAQRLHITVGSLTVAVNTLCRKGYVTRERSSEDRRCIHLTLTEKARAVDEKHRAFHRQMTDAIMNRLSDEQLDVLTGGLSQMADYFETVLDAKQEEEPW